MDLKETIIFTCKNISQIQHNNIKKRLILTHLFSWVNLVSSLSRLPLSPRFFENIVLCNIKIYAATPGPTREIFLDLRVFSNVRFYQTELNNYVVFLLLKKPNPISLSRSYLFFVEYIYSSITHFTCRNWNSCRSQKSGRCDRPGCLLPGTHLTLHTSSALHGSLNTSKGVIRCQVV